MRYLENDRYGNIKINIEEGNNVFFLPKKALIKDTSNPLKITYYDLNSIENVYILTDTDEFNIGSTFINSDDSPLNHKFDKILNKILWVVDLSLNEIKFNKNQMNGSLPAAKNNLKIINAYSTFNGIVIANSLSSEDSSSKAYGSEIHYTGGYLPSVPISEKPGEPTKPEEPDKPVEEENNKVEDVLTDDTNEESSSGGSNITDESDVLDTNEEPRDSLPQTGMASTLRILGLDFMIVGYTIYLFDRRKK